MEAEATIGPQSKVKEFRKDYINWLIIVARSINDENPHL